MYPLSPLGYRSRLIRPGFARMGRGVTIYGEPDEYEYLVDHNGNNIVDRSGNLLITGNALYGLKDHNGNTLVDQDGNVIAAYRKNINFPSNPTPPPDPGPIMSETSLACWIPFSGDPNDDSANAHDFSPQNGPGYITGPGGTGQAIEFNSASNEYANIADHPDFDCTGAFSVGAWLRTNDLSVDTGFFQKLAGATGCLIFWEMPAAHWRFRANLSNSTNPADTSADWVADDSWQHFIFTRANATADIKVYKNAGTPVVLPTGGATVTANTNTADLGRYFANPGEMDIAEFFLFNRELTSDEVATIYNSGDRLSYADITWT